MASWPQTPQERGPWAGCCLRTMGSLLPAATPRDRLSPEVRKDRRELKAGYLGRKAGVRSTHLVQGAAASTCHWLPGAGLPSPRGKADPRTRKAVCSLVLCQEPQCPGQKGGWWELPQHSPEGSLGATGYRNKPHGNSNHNPRCSGTHGRHSEYSAGRGCTKKNRRLSCPPTGTA